MAATRGRASWLALIVLVVTFLAGAFSGAAFERSLSARGSADARLVRVSKPGGADHDHRDRLFAALDVTPEQRVALDSIMDRREAQIHAFWERHGPGLRALMDSTRAEIRTVLTEEQAAEFERLMKERKRRKGKR